MTENKISHFDIEAKKNALMNKKKENQEFDIFKFEEDIKRLQENNGNLSSLQADDYIKDNNKAASDISYAGDGDISFHVIEINNMYVATGPNGQRIFSKDFEELNLKIAKEFKKHAEENNIPLTGVQFTTTCKDKEKYRKKTEIFARVFINEGIRVSGDLPTDPKFWQDLKKEYLQNKEHNEEMWNSLTKKVPAKSLGLENESESLNHIQNQHKNKTTRINQILNSKAQSK